VHSEGPGVNAILSLMGQPMEGSLRSHSTRRRGNSGPAIADHIRLHNPLSYGSRAIPLPNGKNKSGASAYDPSNLKNSERGGEPRLHEVTSTIDAIPSPNVDLCVRGAESACNDSD
jgi:hypothetical protein